MANAPRDENHIATLLGVSSVDGTTPVVLFADPTTHRLLVDLPGGAGDVVGPASSTDNAIVRFDSTTGKLIQNSVVTIADTTGDTAGMGTLNTHTIPGGTSTFAILTNKLSDFAATTSAELAGVISDETGSGLLVFGTSPTLITPALGTPSALVGTNITGTGSSFTAGAVTNATLTTALTVDTGTVTLTGNIADTSVLTIGAGAVSVSGANTGDQTTISGNAGTATALETARTIGGVSFDGTANITVATATGGFAVTAGDLTIGTTSANDVQPSLKIIGDADSDAGGDTDDTLELTLTPNADPTLATWDFTSTQSAGYTFDKNLTFAANDILLGTGTGDKASILLNDSALADESWSGTTEKGTGGATIAVGDVCYQQTSDSRWELVDGILDGTDVGFKLRLGICVLATTDGAATEMLLDGLIASAAFPTFTVGAPVYLDDTAGNLVVAQPSTTNFAIRVVGEAKSATVLHFHPSNDFIVHV